MAKTPTKRKAPTRAPTKAAETKAAIEAAQVTAATTMDPQTGQDVVHDEKPAKSEVAKQFAEADRKADPDAIAEATLSRSIRGW